MEGLLGLGETKSICGACFKRLLLNALPTMPFIAMISEETNVHVRERGLLVLQPVLHDLARISCSYQKLSFGKLTVVDKQLFSARCFTHSYNLVRNASWLWAVSRRSLDSLGRPTKRRTQRRASPDPTTPNAAFEPRAVAGKARCTMPRQINSADEGKCARIARLHSISSIPFNSPELSLI